MKFLVILTALLINYYWTRDRVLPGDTWFRHLLASLRQTTATMSNAPQWYAVLALLVPAFAISGLLWLVDGALLGLISFCIHVSLLLFLFDPRPLRLWIAQYLNHWREEDYEAAYLFMGEHCPDLPQRREISGAQVHSDCITFLLGNSFERLFAVLFWYLVLGPAGALVYYALVRLLGDSEQDASAQEIPWLERLQFVLEWVPARLLGLTFALAGQFEATFASLSALLLDSTRSAKTLVIACAYAAIGKARADLVVHDSSEQDGHATHVIDMEREDTPLSASSCVEEIEQFLALIDRSQIIWISALALFALVGIEG